MWQPGLLEQVSFPPSPQTSQRGLDLKERRQGGLDVDARNLPGQVDLDVEERSCRVLNSVLGSVLPEPEESLEPHQSLHSSEPPLHVPDQASCCGGILSDNDTNVLAEEAEDIKAAIPHMTLDKVVKQPVVWKRVCVAIPYTSAFRKPAEIADEEDAFLLQSEGVRLFGWNVARNFKSLIQGFALDGVLDDDDEDEFDEADQSSVGFPTSGVCWM